MGIAAGKLLEMLQGRGAGALRRLFEANYLEASCRPPGGRYLRLVERFQALFPGVPVSLARAPGRINLIGEHTDYNGLPVFPFAIHRDLAAAFGPREDGRVVLHNLDPAYPPREFRLEAAIPPYATGDWGNYLKAAAQGLLDRFGAGGGQAGPAPTPVRPEASAA